MKAKEIEFSVIYQDKLLGEMALIMDLKIWGIQIVVCKENEVEFQIKHVNQVQKHFVNKCDILEFFHYSEAIF